VFTAHYIQNTPRFDHPADRAALRAVATGAKGVDLFFVLSGFLITGILIDTRAERSVLGAFYARRALRILPLYYGTLAGLAAWEAWHGRFGPEYVGRAWWYWVYLQNVATTFALGPVDGPGHFWSLAVEEHFYLVWPFVVRRTTDRQLLAVCLGMAGAALAARGAFALAGIDWYEFTLTRMDSLAAGGAVAVVARRPGPPPRAVWWAVAAGVGLLVLALGLRAAHPTPVWAAVADLLKPTGAAAVFAVLVALAARPRGRVADLFAAGWLRRLGVVSYGVYVYHPYVLWADWGTGWVHRLAADHSPWAGAAKVGMYFALLAATYLIAEVSYRLVEHPVMRLKRYFEYRPVGSRPALPGPGPAVG
jgi:peptidoglycan/LPS O-acetylase OafA/YrhL